MRESFSGKLLEKTKKGKKMKITKTYGSRKLYNKLLFVSYFFMLYY
jgi:hypothetical protein